MSYNRFYLPSTNVQLCCLGNGIQVLLEPEHVDILTIDGTKPSSHPNMRFAPVTPLK